MPTTPIVVTDGHTVQPWTDAYKAEQAARDDCRMRLLHRLYLDGHRVMPPRHEIERSVDLMLALGATLRRVASSSSSSSIVERARV